MNREVIEQFRSAVAVMTAVVDQYDEEERATLTLASQIATQYVSEEGPTNLINGLAHLSMWLMQRIKIATGDEMETTLQNAGAEASRYLDGGE